MNWKFWQKTKYDKTTIQVTKTNLTEHQQIYVEAQTSEKALELIEKLREKK